MSGRRRRFQRALRRLGRRARRPADPVRARPAGPLLRPSFLLVPPALEAQADRIARGVDSQIFSDPHRDRGEWNDFPRFAEWAGDRHTTSAVPPGASFGESWKRVTEGVRAIVEALRPPTVDFFGVPGSKDVAVLINGEPAGVLTAEQFEELKRKLEAAR